jgi:hypothetical protein
MQLPFYNVQAPVGPGKANRIDDVMLVQILLRETAKTPQMIWAYGLPPMLVTGVADGNLFKWILAFQNFCGPLVTKDGIVDPARDALHLSTISHSDYTISVLNRLLRSAASDVYTGLPIDDSTPQLLRDALWKNAR